LAIFWAAENYIASPVKFAKSKVTKKRLPVLTAEEPGKAISHCTRSRDQALIMFMADTGLRRAEVCALDWGDVDFSTGLVTVRRGKGGTARSAVAGASTRRAVLAYRRTIANTTDDAPLFQARQGARFTGSGLLQILRRLSTKTGLHITPHALRRTFVILSLRADMDVLLFSEKRNQLHHGSHAAPNANAGSIISALMATRSNDAWLSDLRADGAARESALADLGGIIRHGLPYALSRWVSPDDPLFTPLVEEVTQDTLVRVLDQLKTFEGRSLFTTWAQKIAVRIALTELRRKRWQDSSLDELIDSERPAAASLLADTEPGPDAIAERSDMIARVRRVLEEELTPKQREALILLGIQDVPLEEAAKRMKTNRNALYKLLHDARLRLKRRLKAEGLTAQEVLAAFERP